MGCTASSDMDAHRAARRRARQTAAAEREQAAFTALMASPPASPRVSLQCGSWPNNKSTADPEPRSPAAQDVPPPNPLRPFAAPQHDALAAHLRGGDASALACEEEVEGRTSPGIVTGREPSPQIIAQRQLDISTELYARGFNDDVDQFADEVAATDRAHRTCYGRDVSRQAMVHSWVSEASASPRDRSFD